MLFRRRKPADMWDRLRMALWPRRSFWRSLQYFSKRVLRLTATPHAIAAGVAAGVFASFLPYPGFHFILAGVFAFCVGGNLVASALGTMIGNPLTFPFIWSGSLSLGRFVLYGRHPEEMVPLQLGHALRHLEFVHLWNPFLKPMTIGGSVLGLIAALLVYGLTRWAVAAFRAQRQVRLAARAKRRADRLTPSRA